MKKHPELKSLFNEAMALIEKYEIKSYSITINPTTYVIPNVNNYVSIQGESKLNDKLISSLDFAIDNSGEYLVCNYGNINLIFEIEQ